MTTGSQLATVTKNDDCENFYDYGVVLATVTNLATEKYGNFKKFDDSQTFEDW